jgi:aryl-alcohol dehydrogenase-like predicted oxidoreductase
VFDGSMEKLLGQWHKARNNRDDLIIIAKGAHTPNCDPNSLSEQLTISLNQLQIDQADIYIMHRDNIEVPVSEFMDALNKEKEKGRIKIFGGSNWSLERFIEANEWAKKNEKEEMAVLNNDLALSKMINPLWQGCVSSNDAAILEHLRTSQKAHLSWSSQGRGYFLPEKIRQSIEETHPCHRGLIIFERAKSLFNTAISSFSFFFAHSFASINLSKLQFDPPKIFIRPFSFSLFKASINSLTGTSILSLCII